MSLLKTCKFEKVAIKNEGVMPRTRSNIGFLSTQEQVTLRRIVQYSRNSNLSVIVYACPGYLHLVICEFKEVALKTKGAMP